MLPQADGNHHVVGKAGQESAPDEPALSLQFFPYCIIIS